MDGALSMMVLMLMMLITMMIMRTQNTRQTTFRWHVGFNDGVVFSGLFLFSHLGPGPRPIMVLKHLQTSETSALTDWSVPHNTIHYLDSIFVPIINSTAQNCFLVEMSNSDAS